MKNTCAYYITIQVLKVCTSHHQFFCLILFYISFWPINCQQCCPHRETSQLICIANRLTVFCVGATLAVNCIISECHFSQLSRTSFSIAKKKKIHLNRFTQTPCLHNGQGLLIDTKAFCWCSLITVLYLFKKKDCHSLIQR